MLSQKSFIISEFSPSFPSPAVKKNPLLFKSQRVYFVSENRCVFRKDRFMCHKSFYWGETGLTRRSFCGQIALTGHNARILPSVPKFTANLYCICLSIYMWYAKAGVVQICRKFWDTQQTSWVLYKMVAQNMSRTHEGKKVFPHNKTFF